MTADNTLVPCACGGTMVHIPQTTGSEAGYRCLRCGRFEPDIDATRMPRQTPCVYDKKTEGA